MLARELAELLMKNPDAEATVSVWDGDYSDEHEVEGVTDWGSFISINHARKR